MKAKFDCRHSERYQSQIDSRCWWMTDHKIDGELCLKDHKGKTFDIPRKNACLPNPGLGFLICPNGDQSYEFKKRLAQAMECASRVRTAALTVPEA